MISVRRIRIGEGELFRSLRLEALKESPSAFAATYESALSRTAESWSQQADSTAVGKNRATFIVFDDVRPVGLAALYRDEKRLETGEIIQVWIEPRHRGICSAARLMEAVFAWAEDNCFRRLIATVKSDNGHAIRFYRKCGFSLADGSSDEGPEDCVLTKNMGVAPTIAAAATRGQ